MKRYRIIPISVDPEVEEFALLNSKVKDNLRRSRAEAATLYAILCLQDRVRLAKAKERHRRSCEHRHAALLSKLRYQVVLCLLCFLGICLLWHLDLLSVELVYGAALVCTYKIAFSLGRVRNKYPSKGGDNN